MAASWWDKIKVALGAKSPLPDQWQGMRLYELPILAIDLELTSLDPQTAKVTSIGWVEGKGSNIALDTCYYNVIRAKGDLAQSPVIHGLTAEDIAKGEHILDALNALNKFANSHIWCFHNASLDMGVLNAVMKNNNIAMADIVTLDTLLLAIYQLKKQHDVLPPNSATLTVCRQRFDLPLVPAHNALDDAMATLQLWYAQQHQLDPTQQMTIDELLHTQAITVRNLGM